MNRAVRPRRRGNYAMLFVVAMVVVLGFGAIALDIGYMLMAREQAQGVADGAAQSAMVTLRQTGDQALARQAAQRVIAQNRIAGVVGDLDSLVFGTWDDASPNPSFQPTSWHPNALRLTVSRDGDKQVPYLLSRVWGFESFAVHGSATAASRSIQLVIVLDETGSWGERDFLNARAAVRAALDTIAATASDVDEVGLVVFTGRYAWEYTPFTDIAIPGNHDAVRAQWSLLNIASKAGRDTNPSDGVDCTLNAAPRQNDFTSPAGGCYPAMPREYTDEPGTDHSTGVLMAERMFTEREGSAAYRAMIVLTDGRPNDLLAGAGTIRTQQGYVETRWREFRGPVPRSKDQIRNAAIQATDRLWNDGRVHTWVVSLIEDDWMMPRMAHGDGYYVRTNSSSELAFIFRQIVSEMPLGLVE